MTRIKELRKENKWSQTELAKKLAVAQNTVSNWEKGSRQPDNNALSGLAAIFNVSVDYILGLTDIKKAPAGVYPVGDVASFSVIASVRAGYDSSAVENFSDEVEAIPMQSLSGYPVEECRVLRVKGNSMYPRICDGDLVLVHVQSSVESGETAVILYNGDEATIKKVVYVPGEDWLDLIPANPEYETKRIEGPDLEICRVFGKVIRLIREF